MIYFVTCVSFVNKKRKTVFEELNYDLLFFSDLINSNISKSMTDMQFFKSLIINYELIY